MKKQNKFREWLADKVLDLYFWLAEMTEQEYWERANMFRPTQDTPDLLPAPACCASFVSYGVHHRDCRLAFPCSTESR